MIIRRFDARKSHVALLTLWYNDASSVIPPRKKKEDLSIYVSPTDWRRSLPPQTKGGLLPPLPSGRSPTENSKRIAHSGTRAEVHITLSGHDGGAVFFFFFEVCPFQHRVPLPTVMLEPDGRSESLVMGNQMEARLNGSNGTSRRGWI